jgi:hypothetical protein
MKKKLLWLTFILITSGVVIASYKPVMDKIMEVPISRTISFSLYKGSNYTSQIYKSSSATINITIWKIRTASQDLVWDTTIDAKQLSKYPLFKKAISKTVTIPNIYKSKDHLEINYVLTYNSNGSILTIPSDGYFLDNTDTLAIRL